VDRILEKLKRSQGSDIS
jgi:hypothetical protein